MERRGHLPEQELGNEQRGKNIKGLGYQESIQRSLVIGIKQVGKPGLQSNTGKGQNKPQSLNTF
jgi:hypothetical protein